MSLSIVSGAAIADVCQHSHGLPGIVEPAKKVIWSAYTGSHKAKQFFSPNIFRLGSLEVSAIITHQRGKHLGKTQDRVLDVVRDRAQLCLALVVHDEDTELSACGLPLGFGKSLYLTLDVLLQLSDRVSVRIAQQGTRRVIGDIASLKRFA